MAQIRPFRLLLKTLLFFLLIDAVFWVINPPVGKLGLYNFILPGRERFSYMPSEEAGDLDAHFASHKISASPKEPADEFRVVLVGDSSVWGYLLQPEQTLAGNLDQAGLEMCGRPLRAYNLGYPYQSLTKDLLFVNRAMEYQPDMIIWLVSLYSFMPEYQLRAVVRDNYEDYLALDQKYHLGLEDNGSAGFLRHSLVAQRRKLTANARIQLYGILWAATGKDAFFPEEYSSPKANFGPNNLFQDRPPTTLTGKDLLFNLVNIGHRVAGDVPIVLVNEPIFISSGRNSDLRYNEDYPRWAYNQYRSLLRDQSLLGNWNYFDFWDLNPSDEFTNTPFHLTVAGERRLSERMLAILKNWPCQ